MAAPHFARLTIESAFGTAKTTPTAGTEQIVLRLPESNSFQVDVQPVHQDIAYGGGLDVLGDVVFDHVNVGWDVSTLLYPAQAPLLLKWALTRKSGSSPWTSSEPTGDLLSMYGDRALTTRTGTVVRKSVPGMKVSQLVLSASRQDPKARLRLRGVCIKEIGNPIDSSSDPDATAFPAPAEADYPTGPYLFSHTATNFMWNGSALAKYESVTLTVDNMLDTRFFESRWADSIDFTGRKVTVDAVLLFKTSPDLRSQLQSLERGSLSIEFDNGTNSAKIDMGATGFIRSVKQDLQLGKVAIVNAQFVGCWDPDLATDLTVTTT